jgi:hypothetical protein
LTLNCCAVNPISNTADLEEEEEEDDDDDDKDELDLFVL